MNCLIDSCVYPPEPVVSAHTSAQLAERLACLKHSVTVVTSFPNRPAGKIFPGFSRKLIQRDQVGKGIEIFRCFSTLSGESRMLSRMAENLTFGLTAGWRVLTLQRPDVIYANTWPIFAAGVLLFVARLRRIPVVMSVQDLYPESLVVQGRIREYGLVARVLRWADGMIAQRCRRVIVISKAFYRCYKETRGISEERLDVVPNWIDTKSLAIGPKISSGYRASKGIPEYGFVCVYAGNVGAAAGVEMVIEAFGLLSSEEESWLIIAGQGSRLGACQKLAARLENRRVVFYAPYPTEDEPMILGAADILILPTRGQQSKASVPSKVLTYMLSGRPIIATALPESDLGNLVKEAGCGWVVAPDRPDQLAAKIREVMGLDARERIRRGEMGRQYVIAHFSKDVCLPKVIQLIENAAG